MEAKSLAFHLAFPVDDMDATRSFYCDMLGCRVGRFAERWIDFDFYGHQLSAHLRRSADAEDLACNAVDGDAVPIRHFGVILDWDAFVALRERLETAKVVFRIAPRIRFAGEVGEQATMFFDDPSGNAIEIKSFRDPSRIFQTESLP
jgi:uncharacterized protein